VAKRSKRQLNKLNSIHDPPDPSPRILPPEAQHQWAATYQDGLNTYGKDDLARRAAWREIKLRWKQSGKKTWNRCDGGVCTWPGPEVLPMPESDLVGLGVLVEYVFLDRAGKLRVMSLDRNRPPILWWDDERKAVYAFPKQDYPACRPIPADMHEAVKTYEKWHQRRPDCYDDVVIPDVRIKAVGAGDSLSYASDKWNDPDPDPRLKDAQEYIHNHWYDVWVWQDNMRDPEAIMIEGGELDLHERGLIH
jgi:hypothetical protein